ncbi:MAG: RDD family protein [Actinomycetota bacterium]|nr:RDD family protein [Actinomycetota bacterium]
METDTGLVSGEGVRLALLPAGVGSRVIASLIDIAIEAAAYFILVFIDIAVAGTADEAAVRAVLVVEVVLVLAGYPIVLEWTTRGRTVGKMCLGLRVVRDDGGPIAFRQAAVRGLASLLLEKPGLLFPFTTIVGLLTISMSTREKRIGDMMAGTVVLNERSSSQTLAIPPLWVPVPLQPWVLSLDMHRLDDGLALAVRQFVSRAHAMTLAAQGQLGYELLQRVLAVTTPPPPAGAPVAALLSSVLAERRRRATVAMHAPRPPAYAAPPADYPVAQQVNVSGNRSSPDDDPPEAPFAMPR